MEKYINFHDRKISYTLKVSSRARYMRLAVYCGGELVVTAPKSVKENMIEKFIYSKSDWVIDKIDKLSNVAKSLTKNESNIEDLKHKEMARGLAKAKLEKFNEFYKFKYNQISVRNQKTRWGSCSRKGNLNFNYKIATISEQLADYIVVHELCHLGEFNHSPRFWNLVGKTLPNYLNLRKELKEIRSL